MDARAVAADRYRGFVRAALILVLLSAAAVALSAPAVEAAQKCATRIFRDWSDNHRIDRVYGIACYRAAIKALPVDVRTYSSAEDDIRRAMLYAQSDKADPGDQGPPASAATSSEASASEGATKPASSPVPSVRPAASPRVARTKDVRAAGAPVVEVEGAALPIPLPLIGLAAVSALLLGIGSVGYVTRRIAQHSHGD